MTTIVSGTNGLLRSTDYQTPTGYITIKDSGGTTRRLLVG
jgi:hypothetical protein